VPGGGDRPLWAAPRSDDDVRRRDVAAAVFIVEAVTFTSAAGVFEVPSLLTIAQAVRRRAFVHSGTEIGVTGLRRVSTVFIA
jgi:hypothetical protein